MKTLAPTLALFLGLGPGLPATATAQERAPAVAQPVAPPQATATGQAPVGAPGQVVVTMHEDAALHGTVVEVTNGGHPSVVTVVPWRQGAPEAQGPAPLPAIPAPTPPQPQPAARGAWVHVNADPGVVLESVAPGETNWRTVCTAPCDVLVAAESLYRVNGPDLETSKSFQLGTDAGGHVTLDVHPVTRGAHDLAEGLVIGGGVALTSSAVVLYIDLIEGITNNACYAGGSCGGPAALTWTGIGLAAAGVAALIGGAVTLQSTAVTQSFGPRSDERRAPAARLDDRWRRLPSWKDDPSMVGLVPTAVTAPVFSTTF